MYSFMDQNSILVHIVYNLSICNYILHNLDHISNKFNFKGKTIIRDNLKHKLKEINKSNFNYNHSINLKPAQNILYNIYGKANNLISLNKIQHYKQFYKNYFKVIN